MLINEFCLDIIIYISSKLEINILGNFILHDKSIYFHKYTILKNNQSIIKYLEFDNTTSYYYLIFNNSISNIFDSSLYNKQHNYNINELYAITNILSYNIANDKINREIAGIYLFNIFIKSKSTNYNYRNIVKSKNKRLALCCTLFGSIFNYDWEYLNINLYDLFNIINCIVYKNYNKLYDILYNVKIHKKITPLKTLHILINYKIDIDYYDDNSYDYDKTCLLKYVIIYILYNYIENIQNYIIDTEFNKLVPIIIYKCYEIKETISDNKRIPNNLKLLFLKQINNVCNIFTLYNIYVSN
jgi:hypothetical protein